MASSHLPEPDLNSADSVSSTPRSDHQNRWHDEIQPRVRFMCSFGGRILPRPHDNQLRYVGGDTRIVAVHRSTTFSALLSKLSKLSSSTDFTVKYQLPNEDLDALISVTTDEDLDNMMEEYDRLSLSSSAAQTPRLRLFLFPQTPSRSTSISSMLDGSASSKHWFLDALNGGPSSLERGRSEVSSIVSEVPDYLFGLDNESSDATKAKNKTSGSDGPREHLSFVSDPGSPAPPVAPSPYCSTSSATVMPADLPPVKTKPEATETNLAGDQAKESLTMEQQLPWSHQITGYAPGGGNPVSVWQQRYLPETHLQGQAVQRVPVYYVPAGNVPMRPMQMQVPYLQGVAAPPFYRGHPIMANPVGPPQSQVYGGQILQPAEIRPISAVDGYDLPPPPAAGMVTAEGGQILYGQRGPGLVTAYPPAAGPVVADMHVTNPEAKTG